MAIPKVTLQVCPTRSKIGLFHYLKKKRKKEKQDSVSENEVRNGDAHKYIRLLGFKRLPSSKIDSMINSTSTESIYESNRSILYGVNRVSRVNNSLVSK